MTRPERFITVWCPDWPVVAAGRGKGGPAAVVAAHRIVARSDAAAAEGVVVGQRRRQAQSRCPSIELIEHDPARDAREFEAIVRAVVEIAPRVDVVEPGWISLAARGPSRYFGGDLAVADHLVSVVTAVAPGVSVGVGVADGRFTASVAARLAVRRGAPVVVEPGGSAPFCAPLSIGWLQTLGDADADLVDLFVRLGLRRLGELAALSASDVLGRFGHAGAHAH
ncbi:MAG: DNA polymerase Y family protein, partial [Actinomycetota bacterium]